MSKRVNFSKNLFSEIYEKTGYLKENQNGATNKEKFIPADSNKNLKGHIFYNTHSYPTKIPADIIVRHIISNTSPGQTILDPFCGSGMTGLAAKLTGRNSFVSDLGTLALHLASNHVARCSSFDLKNHAAKILDQLEATSPYTLFHKKKELEVNYVLYADILKCSQCGKKISTWEIAKNTKSFSVPAKISCPACKTNLRKSELESLGKSPVQISFFDRLFNGADSSRVLKLDRTKIDLQRSDSSILKQIASTPFESNREMYKRQALHLQKVTCLRDFYSDSNWYALSNLYQQISEVEDVRIRAALMLAFTNTAWHGSKLRRFNSKGGHRPLTGTLYFPQLYSEGNCYRIFENKIESLSKYFLTLEQYATNSTVTLSRNSATDLSHIDDRSIDYIFTDPPFGSNIFYADCNFIAEAWLGEPTDTTKEAVLNKSLKSNNGGKTLDDYANLMKESFKEMQRALKNTGQMSLVFNSTSGSVWQALMDSLSDSGMEINNANQLDKIQLSVKGYKSKEGRENVATTDIILSVRKKKKPHVRIKKTLDLKGLRKAYSMFLKEEDGIPSDFHAANFFSFLLKHCHLEGYSFEELTMSKIADFLSTQAMDIVA